MNNYQKILYCESTTYNIYLYWRSKKKKKMLLLLLQMPFGKHKHARQSQEQIETEIKKGKHFQLEIVVNLVRNTFRGA